MTITLAQIDNGLIRHYSFDGNTNDTSGFDNHATAYNDFQYVPGVFNEAIYLVGSGHTGLNGGHVLLPTIDFDNLPEFTIGMWVNYQDHTTVHSEALIQFGRGATPNHSIYGISYNPTAQVINFFAGGPWTSGVSDVATPFPADFQNNWHHLTLLVGNGELAGYLNGQLVGTDSYTMPTSMLEDVAGIGAHWFDSGGTESNRFIGSVDEVRIWDRALTDDEIELIAEMPEQEPQSCTDNFNDNSIDDTLWSTIVGSGTITETNRRVEFSDWGFLTTVQEYNPHELGMVVISGTWWSPNNWNVSASDRLKIATRSDGTLGNGAGVLANGILFETNWDFAAPRLVIAKRNGNQSEILTESPADFGPGDVIDFLITDDGTNLSFTIQPRNPGRQSTTLTTTDSEMFSQNHVVFYSRPNHNGLQTRCYFDDIAVSNASLYDDFDDNSIDNNLWSTLVGNGSITATNQSVEFSDWGFLTTEQEFDASQVGTVIVSGTWWSPNNWNVSASDRLKVATRSDGALGNGAGNLANGILFETNWDFAIPRLVIGKHSGNQSQLLAEVPADFGPGDIIDFLITDDGEKVTFTIQPQGEGRQPTIITATDNELFDENRVVFYSRPDHNGLQTLSYFDDLSVTANHCDVLLGDLNVDGFLNLLDVQPFINAINSGLYQTEGDMNQDGKLDLLDVQPFIDVLSSN